MIGLSLARQFDSSVTWEDLATIREWWPSNANICETCENFTPAAEFTTAMTEQLADIKALRADAEQRGWTDEAQRHDRVAHALQGHLDRLRPR